MFVSLGVEGSYRLQLEVTNSSWLLVNLENFERKAHHLNTTIIHDNFFLEHSNCATDKVSGILCR